MLNSLKTKYKKSVLTLTEVAQELGVSENEAKAFVEESNLKVLKIGTSELISIEAFAELLTGNGNKSLETSATSRYNDTNSAESWEINFMVEDDVKMSKGSVCYVKASNRWVVQLDLGKTADGKRIRKSKSFKSEDEARDALAMELAKLGVSSDESKHLYKDVAFDFFRDRCSTVEDRTWDTYKSFAKYSVEAFGEKPIAEITEGDFVNLFNDMKHKFVDSSLKKTKTSAGIIFDYAIKKGYTKENPVKKIRRLPTSVVSATQDSVIDKAFSDEELKYILDCAKKSTQLDGIIYMLSNTGMRPGELRALKLKDIDFDEDTVFVRRAASLSKVYDEEGNAVGKKEYIKDLKNGDKGLRKLKVPHYVLEIAMQQHHRIVNSASYRGPQDTEFLFPGNDGNFMKETNLRSRWNIFRKMYGIPAKHRIYDFRHTLCTNLIRKNVPPSIVQRILGDNTVDVIMEVYTHINTNDMANAISLVHDNYQNLVSTACQLEATKCQPMSTKECEIDELSVECTV